MLNSDKRNLILTHRRLTRWLDSTPTPTLQVISYIRNEIPSNILFGARLDRQNSITYYYCKLVDELKSRTRLSITSSPVQTKCSTNGWKTSTDCPKLHCTVAQANRWEKTSGGIKVTLGKELPSICIVGQEESGDTLLIFKPYNIVKYCCVQWERLNQKTRLWPSLGRKVLHSSYSYEVDSHSSFFFPFHFLPELYGTVSVPPFSCNPSRSS